MKLIMRNHFLKIVSKQNKLLFHNFGFNHNKNIVTESALGMKFVCCLRLIGSVVTSKVTSFE
jgi:hypothetical protein